MDITITAQKPVSEFLKVAQELVTEIREWANVLWVRVVGCRPRFVSKKAMSKTFNFQKVEDVFKDDVVLDLKNSEIGYVIRKGYDCPTIVKKFNPKGLNLIEIDMSAVKGIRVEPFTDEYNAVINSWKGR